VFAPFEEAYERWLASVRDFCVNDHPDVVEDFNNVLRQPRRAVPTEPRPVWRKQLTLPNDLVTVSLGFRSSTVAEETLTDAICKSFRAVSAIRDEFSYPAEYPPGYTAVLLTSAAVVRKLPEVLPKTAGRELGREEREEEAAYRRILTLSGEMDPDLGPLLDGDAVRSKAERMVFERRAELQAQLTAVAIEAASQCAPVIVVPSGFRKA